MTYRIVRGYRDSTRREVIKTGLSLDQAQAHCRNPETSSSKCTSTEGVDRTYLFGPWFDGYEQEAPKQVRRKGVVAAMAFLSGV
jgi:hypothetical protein